jgi:tRNA dimethylallyltransferase
MTEMWEAGRDPLRGFRVLRIGLDPDRKLLYQRINQRAKEMFLHGLVEETRTLYARYGSSARPLNSLGYKQAAQLMAGQLSLEQAIAAAQQGHRNYAKRQMTWFRREPDVHWLHGFGSDARVQEEALSLIQRSELLS